MAKAAMRLVLLVWEDAAIVDDGPWVEREAPVTKPVIFHQVGWLQEVTNEAIVLTHAVGDHAMAARDRIPRGMVKTILQLDPDAGVPLKLPRKRKAK